MADSPSPRLAKAIDAAQAAKAAPKDRAKAAAFVEAVEYLDLREILPAEHEPALKAARALLAQPENG